MTWQLFSPDLPFLNQITVSQVKYGFWENAITYAPVISATCSLVGIVITYRIAQKAREISSEQKRIAQNKFDVDLFEKRFDVYFAIFDLYNITFTRKTYIIDFKDADFNDLNKDFYENIKIISSGEFLFENDDLKPIVEIYKNITVAFTLFIATRNFSVHGKVLDKLYTPEEAEIFYNNFKEKWKKIYKNTLRKIIFKYLPENALLPPNQRRSNPTARPTSPDTPPPTAPEADQ